MTIEQKVNMALAYKGLTKADLARLLGTTPQNLGQKINNGTMKLKDLNQIAKVLGGSLKLYLDFGDTKI